MDLLSRVIIEQSPRQGHVETLEQYDYTCSTYLNGESRVGNGKPQRSADTLLDCSVKTEKHSTLLLSHILRSPHCKSSICTVISSLVILWIARARQGSAISAWRLWETWSTLISNGEEWRCLIPKKNAPASYKHQNFQKYGLRWYVLAV